MSVTHRVTITHRHASTLEMERTEDQEPNQPNSRSIREACRQGFQEAIPHIVDIASGRIDPATAGTRVRAHDTLGRYGLNRHPLADRPEEWLEIVIEVTREHIEDPTRLAAWCWALRSRLDEFEDQAAPARAQTNKRMNTLPLAQRALIARRLAARLLQAAQPEPSSPRPDIEPPTTDE